MKKILIVALAARAGGGEQIVNMFVNDKFFNDEVTIYLNHTIKMLETEKRKIVQKKGFMSHLIRYLYYKIILPIHIRFKNYDEVYVLDNLMINTGKVENYMYLQQALPFYIIDDYEIDKLTKLKIKLMNKRIIKYIKKSNTVVVQTNAFKSRILEKMNLNKEKIKVEFPQISIKNIENIDLTDNENTYVFPSNAMFYKNHRFLVDALLLIKNAHDLNIQFLFTLHGKENKNIEQIYSLVKEYELPIRFVGKLSNKKVKEIISTGGLFFASSIESFGLPLLEARVLNAPIIYFITDTSNEILDGYENKLGFDNVEELAILLENNFK